MTLEQAKNLQQGDEVYSTRACYSRGGPCRLRINGMAKTWKRDPRRVRVPWKYGLYDYGYITSQSLEDFVLPSEADVVFPDQHVDKQNYLEITPDQVNSREMLILVRGKPISEGYECLGGCYGMRWADIFIGIEENGYAHS